MKYDESCLEGTPWYDKIPYYKCDNCGIEFKLCSWPYLDKHYCSEQCRFEGDKKRFCCNKIFTFSLCNCKS